MFSVTVLNLGTMKSESAAGICSKQVCDIGRGDTVLNPIHNYSDNLFLVIEQRAIYHVARNLRKKRKNTYSIGLCRIENRKPANFQARRPWVEVVDLVTKLFLGLYSIQDGGW